MQDMSVDEILKSIRKVIENNDPKNDKIKERARHDSTQEDVLELTDVVENAQSAGTTDDSLLSKQAADHTAELLKEFVEKAKNVTLEASKKPQTIEDFVVNMIRPELKNWLDDNLPKLVKELVEKEIKRLLPNSKG